MIACPEFTFSDVGASSCTICSAGYSCTTTAETTCEADEYSIEGDTSCHTIAVGNSLFMFG
jgi:hypothetical protein